jgi:predicted acetyltransferase
MQNLILRRLEPKDEKAFITAVGKWDSSIGFMFAQNYEPGMKFSDFLSRLKDNENGLRLPHGHVSSTMLSGFLGDELIGRISIRHVLNEFLLKIGGHIGYGVLPEFRKKGFAKMMLVQALPVAKQVGIQRVLLTCNDDNWGSIKTIEANGGVLENKVEVGESQPLKRRYWIDLNTPQI